MPKVFEYEISKTTMLVGSVTVENDSFDHDFGVKKYNDHFELGNYFIVLADVDGEWTDVTNSIEPERLERLKEKFINWMNESYGGAA